MEKIAINNESIIMFYGNKAGYIKDGEAVTDPMFKRDELVKFLTETNNFNVNWKDGVYDVLASNSPVDAINLKSCRIHQLKHDTDARMRFIGYDDLIMRGFGKPNPQNYNVVFDGEIETNNLDAIYEKFNTNHPEGYEGHSLSMSDVIELYDEKGSSYYYVDSVGFKEIDFGERGQQIEQDNPEQSQGEEPDQEFQTFIL